MTGTFSAFKNPEISLFYTYINIHVRVQEVENYRKDILVDYFFLNRNLDIDLPSTVRLKESLSGDGKPFQITHLLSPSSCIIYLIQLTFRAQLRK